MSGWIVAAVLYANGASLAAALILDDRPKWDWRFWVWIFGWPVLWVIAMAAAAREEFLKRWPA